MTLTNRYQFIKSRVKLFIVGNFEKSIISIESRRLKKILANNDSIVIVHTIGKVGSSSVFSSLQNSPFGISLFHFHALEPTRIRKQEHYYRSSLKKSIPYHLIKSKIVSELLDNYNGEIFIISLIREPISREISSVFQDSFNFIDSIHLKDNGIEHILIDKVNALSIELPEVEWFEREIKLMFGIDVYKQVFDLSKGYNIYTNGKIKMLLLRIEDLDEKFNESCQSLFSTDYNFLLKKDNISEDKFYDADYRSIINNFRIPNSEIDNILNSVFIDHFYRDQRNQIRERWSKNDL